MSQLSFLAEACKETDCPEPTVGSSITGNGHVCKAHNVVEWGRALSRNSEPYYRKLGAELLLETK